MPRKKLNTKSAFVIANFPGWGYNFESRWRGILSIRVPKGVLREKEFWVQKRLLNGYVVNKYSKAAFAAPRWEENRMNVRKGMIS